MKIVLTFLIVFFSIYSYSDAETVNKGDYFAWEFARDSQAYVDGDFISWDEEKNDSYEFRQHFVWTNEELDTIMKKTKFYDFEIDAFYKQYNKNFTDEYYIKHNGKKYNNGTRIDTSASVFELYYTCVLAGITGKDCANFFLNIYEFSVKKFNAQSSKEYRTYNTYGPLNLPITALVWQMFHNDGKTLCRAGKVTPGFDYASNNKIINTDSIAMCSYSEQTEKYKCILNRFYNAPYKCTVSCEGVFTTQENDLLFDGDCSVQSIIPNSRPTVNNAYGMLTTFEDYSYYFNKSEKKLKKIQKKNKRDY